MKEIKGGLVKPTEETSYGQAYVEPDSSRMVADPVMQTMTEEQIRESIKESTRLMNEAARRLDFLQAAQYRDEVLRLNELLKIED